MQISSLKNFMVDFAKLDKFEEGKFLRWLRDIETRRETPWWRDGQKLLNCLSHYKIQGIQYLLSQKKVSFPISIIISEDMVYYHNLGLCSLFINVVYDICMVYAYVKI